MTRPRIISTLLFLAVFQMLNQSVVSGQPGQKRQQLPSPAAESGAERYRLVFTLVDVKEDTDVKSLAIKFFHPQIESGETLPFPRHSFTKLQCVQCHDLGQTVDPTPKFFWQALLDNPDALQTWISDSKHVSIIARPPALVVKPDRTAVVDAKSEQAFDYFERREDGLFELKEDLLKTGISIRATVKTTGDRDRLRLDPIAVSVTAIKERQKIMGASLPPVGRPILTTTSIETSVLAKIGDSQIISIDSPKGGRVLIAIKITRDTARN